MNTSKESAMATIDMILSLVNAIESAGGKFNKTMLHMTLKDFIVEMANNGIRFSCIANYTSEEE